MAVVTKEMVRKYIENQILKYEKSIKEKGSMDERNEKELQSLCSSLHCLNVSYASGSIIKLYENEVRHDAVRQRLRNYERIMHGCVFHIKTIEDELDIVYEKYKKDLISKEDAEKEMKKLLEEMKSENKIVKDYSVNIESLKEELSDTRTLRDKLNFRIL